MDARKKKWAEIRKDATFYAQQSGRLLVPSMKVGRKRKHPMDRGKSSKKVQGPANFLDQEEMVQKMPEPPRHGIGKRLMISQGPITNTLAPLLVRSKGFTVDIACLLVQDVDLDECTEHETNAFGDSSLFHLMKVSLVSRCVFYSFRFVDF